MIHIGMDVHKQFSQVEAMDDSGRVLDRRKLLHLDKEAMSNYFRELPSPATVTLEATRNWYWLYELVEEYCEVKLAHPQKVKLIAEAKVKTDKIDAHVLAQLERTGFLPESYIPSRSIRDQRELLRYRMVLIKIRTGLKNRIHALLDKLGIFHPYSDLFGGKGRAFLSGLRLRTPYSLELDGYLDAIRKMDELEEEVTQKIKASLRNDAKSERLMTIPGIGKLTAHLLLAEIGQIGRFASAKKLRSYACLAPGTRQSAQHHYHGPVGHHGNLYLKWAMIEAAQKAATKDPAIAAFYQKMKLRLGWAKAKVAVASKLLTAVYYILKREENYKPNSLTKIHLGKPVTFSGHRIQEVSSLR